ncbi:MAG: hypothetical protein WBV40_08630, partial [Candidatus Cybelea sp.]
MSTLNSGRYAIGICAAICVLAGCGGRTGGDSAVPLTTTGNDVRHRQEFAFSGIEQIFTVPPGVSSIKIDALGASGGGANGSQGSKVTAGAGGEIKATIPVTPGQR